jgi:hypothetical protein
VELAPHSPAMGTAVAQETRTQTMTAKSVQKILNTVPYDRVFVAVTAILRERERKRRIAEGLPPLRDNEPFAVTEKMYQEFLANGLTAREVHQLRKIALGSRP